MAGFPNYTYPAYGGYNPVTPFAPAPTGLPAYAAARSAARTGRADGWEYKHTT